MLRTWCDRLLNRKGRLAQPFSLLPHAAEDVPLHVEQMEDRVAPIIVGSNPLPFFNPSALVKNIIGTGITSVGNVTEEGSPDAFGRFQGGLGSIGMANGIVIGTGAVTLATGPWLGDNTASIINGTPGDADITPIAGAPTFDAAGLSFDFIPTGNVVTFQFVFASEEYDEFVGTPFNDAFVFLINGQNFGKVPGTRTPIDVNTVNDGNPVTGAPAKNPQFFIDNEQGLDAGHLNINMDGLTVVFTAYVPVNEGVVNHIKIAIADAKDAVFDSNLFIKQSSFSSLTVNAYAPVRFTRIVSVAGDPKQDIFSGNVTVLNLGSQNIVAPIFMIFNSLPEGVRLLNFTGRMSNGNPYIALPANMNLLPGQPFYVPIKLLNPRGVPLPTFYQEMNVSFSSVLI